MQIAVMGAGGIGGYLGGRLAAAGEDVSFIARGAHLAAMQSNGLRIESAFGNEHLPAVAATDAPAEIGPVDLVLFTVKLYDSEKAAAALAPLMTPQTRIVTLQNGIDSIDIISRFVSREQVIGGSIYMTASVSAPGVITHPGGSCHLVVGEGRGSAVIRALEEACRRAKGIDFEANADIETVLWEKFITLSAFSGATSLLRAPLGPIIANDETRAFALQLLDEGVAIAKASGKTIRQDFRAEAMQLWKRFPPETRASMARDLDSGKPLELEWLSGRMHKLGPKLDVPTPGHSAVYRGLVLHAGGAAR